MKEPDLVAVRCQCCGEWRWVHYNNLYNGDNTPKGKRHFCNKTRCAKERYSLHNKEVWAKTHPHITGPFICLNCGKPYEVRAQSAGSVKYPYCQEPACQLARSAAHKARNKAAQAKHNEGQPKKLKGNHKENRPEIQYTDRLCLRCGKPVEYHDLDEYWHCDRCRERINVIAGQFDNDFLHFVPDTFVDLLDVYTPEGIG